MRTLVAGLRALKRSPTAMIPLALEGAVAGILVAIGLFPASGASAAAGAAFPLDVYFDLKQALATTSSWPLFAIVAAAGIAIRAAALAATLWLSEGAPGSFAQVWMRATKLVATGLAILLPSAVLLYMGVAIRYAPFIWVGALVGFFPSLALARKAVMLDVGDGKPGSSGIPEGLSYLSYGYALAVLGAAMSSLASVGDLAAGALLVCAGPLNALVLLGWREHARAETYPGGGFVSAAITLVVIGMLGGATIYDRYVRSPSPVGKVSGEGTLLLLGGIDSTAASGALADFDPRQVGYPDKQTETLSYRGANQRHSAADTHRDLDRVAPIVADQIGSAPRPGFLLGHSQAALILDRILDRGLTAPDRSVALAPPPPFPPPIEAPAPGENAMGRPGADAARAMSGVLDLVGGGVDIDGPVSPTHLRPVVVIDARVPRLSVWALGDSVWLEGDWRRPGEVNLVAVTDHVGVTNDARALDAAAGFFRGEAIESDVSSWRGALVAVLKHAFAPWRPSLAGR